MNIRLQRFQLQPRRGLAFAGAIAAAGASLRSPALEASATQIRWSLPHARFGQRFHPELPSGMRYCPNFISRAEEQELDKLLEAGPWQFLADARLRHIKSRAQQFFGLVYYQTSHELPALQPNHPASQREARPLQELPEWLMQRIVATGAFPREGEVNQVAANEYLGATGISSHVEEPTAFGANLGTLSLLAPIEMTLMPANQEIRSDGADHGNWVKILLEPRSLLLLQGTSRYDFCHGIRRSRLVQLADGQIQRRGPGIFGLVRCGARLICCVLGKLTPHNPGCVVG
ncbi:unnamed protein product [Effrenium voratum]|nr:unnamed protein product [Effrenium voratum]